MIRIFFSCTVAFSIPIKELLSIESFWKGSIMGLGPCVLTKVLCAPCMGKEKFVVGWAMVGRAEFAYLIAQMAAAGNMIDEDTFSLCIWALLYATIFAPFIFRYVLNQYIKAEGLAPEDNLPEDATSVVIVDQDGYPVKPGKAETIDPSMIFVDEQGLPVKPGAYSKVAPGSPTATTASATAIGKTSEPGPAGTKRQAKPSSTNPLGCLCGGSMP